MTSVKFAHDSTGNLMRIDTAIRVGSAKERLTSNRLADILGVNRSTVSRWWNGKSTPPVSTQKKLSIVFKVSYEEFLRWANYDDQKLS
jgi:transcriptional regulator with XRE-family HTH domain